MEAHEQIEPARGLKYCRACAYWYNPIKGCDCSVSEIINEVDNK